MHLIGMIVEMIHVVDIVPVLAHLPAKGLAAAMVVIAPRLAVMMMIQKSSA
jgi:hypothetical protein